MKDNVIYHYRGKDLVGITVVGAKRLFWSPQFTQGLPKKL
jgi:hypothetical protein